MIKVVEITFHCGEEFNALDMVMVAMDCDMGSYLGCGLVERWYAEEYTEEARENRDKVNLMSSVACLIQALQAYREMYETNPDKEVAND